MNKEVIEKVKKHYIFTTKHELDDNNKTLKEYIEYLEQKESILDKVTNIVKIIIKRTETEFMYGTTDMLEDLQRILNIIEGGSNGK